MSKEQNDLRPAAHSLSIPMEIAGKTVGELISSGDIDISRRGNKVSIRRMDDTSTLCIEYTPYPDGLGISGTQISHRDKKMELSGTVRQMRQEGMSYAEIAKRTGMSPAYARKLCLDGD